MKDKKKQVDTEKLLKKIEDNLNTEIVKKTKSRIQDELEKIETFKREKETVINKVETGYTLAGSYSNIHDIIKIIKEKKEEKSKEWLEESLSKSATTEHKKWIKKNKDKIKIEFNYSRFACIPKNKDSELEIDDSLNDSIVTFYKKSQKKWIKEEYKRSLEQLESSYIQQYEQLYNSFTTKIHRPIVWGMPSIIRTVEGLKDDLVYSGKTLEKTVYIPFTAMHRKLSEANSVMSKYIDASSKSNHLIAHITFIVTNQPYIKTIVEGQPKYIGGRKFIDFPIIKNYEILQNNQNLNQEQYNEFIEEKDNTIGKYILNSRQVNGNEGHSEESLIALLKEESYIKEMVSFLKTKIINAKMGYDSDLNHKFKIYAVNLFINTERNICGSCEYKLYELMTLQNQGSFLFLLKNGLCSTEVQMFESPIKNNGFPCMFISVSAYKVTNFGVNYYNGANTLYKDAKQALDKEPSPIDEEFLNLSLDIKQISGKLILSTAEWWSCGMSEQDYFPYIEKFCNNSTKLPFYSGFKSNQSVEDKSKLSDYDVPYCQDGINMLGIISDHSEQ